MPNIITEYAIQKDFHHNIRIRRDTSHCTAVLCVAVGVVASNGHTRALTKDHFLDTLFQSSNHATISDHKVTGLGHVVSVFEFLLRFTKAGQEALLFRFFAFVPRTKLDGHLVALPDSPNVLTELVVARVVVENFL